MSTTIADAANTAPTVSCSNACTTCRRDWPASEMGSARAGPDQFVHRRSGARSRQGDAARLARGDHCRVRRSPRLVPVLVGADPKAVGIGDPVEIAWRPAANDAVPVFQLQELTAPESGGALTWDRRAHRCRFSGKMWKLMEASGKEDGSGGGTQECRFSADFGTIDGFVTTQLQHTSGTIWNCMKSHGRFPCPEVMTLSGPIFATC